MTGELALRYALAFAGTQAVEVPLYALGPLRGRRRAVALAFVASLITHPIATVALPALLERWIERPAWTEGAPPTTSLALRALAYVAVCEGFAVGVEALYLRVLGARRPLAWALGANAASFALGAAATLTTGYP